MTSRIRLPAGALMTHAQFAFDDDELPSVMKPLSAVNVCVPEQGGNVPLMGQRLSIPNMCVGVCVFV